MASTDQFFRENPTPVNFDERKSSEVPFLSFFTGAGFLDLGFSQAGFNGVWHNENSRDFVEGFQHGMGSIGLTGAVANIQSTASIVDVGPREVLRAAFGTAGPPSCFGMIGGPPCPDFSVGGKNRGSEGENGKLTDIYARRILEIEPSFFLLENVPGLIRTQKHREFLHSILVKLCERYLVDAKILNALEYRVPQDRERIFIVGLSKKWLVRYGVRRPGFQDPTRLIANAKIAPNDFAKPRGTHWFPWEKHKTYQNPKFSFDWPDTSEFGSNPIRPRAPADLMVGPLLLGGSETEALPNGREFFVPYSNKFHIIREGDVSRKSFKRLHRWRYSPAAAYGNNEVHLHPTEPRRLTVREAMRIQTVPDAFSLPEKMTLSSKFKTIGNGVPVNLAKSVACTIKVVLEEVQNGRFRFNS